MKNAARVARAEERLRIALVASAAGETRARAAQRAGMKEAGLNNLLYKRLGSRAWPISTERKAHD